MGLFDEVRIVKPDGEEMLAQVKCWDSAMHTYKIGDAVPPINGKHTYIIALREGGYLYVLDSILHYWKQELVHIIPIYDKWGDPYEGEPASNLGILGEPYRSGG